MAGVGRGERRFLLAGLLLAQACGEAPEAPATRVDSLIAEGQSAYQEADYDHAIALWNEALPLARGASADPVAEPRILNHLALAAWAQGRLEEGWRLGEASLALKEERGLADEVAWSQNTLGLVAWHQGRIPEAARRLELAVEAATRFDDAEGQARAAGNLGLVHMDRGDFDAARRSFQALLQAGRQLENQRFQGRALVNLGSLAIWDDDPGSAIEVLEEGLGLARAAGDVLGEMNALGQLGSAYAALGDPGRARAVLDSALAGARRHGLAQEEASNLELLGDLYAGLGALEGALSFYRPASEIYGESGLRLDEGNLLRKEAAVLAEAGDLAAARARASSALSIHLLEGGSFEALHDRVLLAEVEARGGRRAAALAQLDSAALLAATLAGRSPRALVAITRARVFDFLGDAEAVLETFRAFREETDSSSQAAPWEVQGLRAKAFAATGAVDSAVSAGRLAVEALENIRDRIGTGTLRTGFVASRSDLYAEVAVALLRADRPEEAFHVADAARGRAILDHLGSARSEVGSGTLIADLAEAERLLRSIDELVRLLEEVSAIPREERSRDDDALESDLSDRLRSARGEYRQLLDRAAWVGTAGNALGVRPPELGDVQAALQPGEALVEYLVAPRSVVALVVTRDSIWAHEAGADREELASRIRLATSLLSRGDSDTASVRPVLEALHRDLVEPLKRIPGAAAASRWIVVPHGALTYLPFAALRDGVSGHALIEDRSLVTLPSAGVLPYLRRPDRPADLVDANASGTAFAPFPDQLPSSATEAAAVASRLGNPGARLGARASEAAVRDALADGTIVHLATHAALNPHNPLFSFIALASPLRYANSAEDGRLEVHEVLGLEVNSPLVYLSGCETGAGPAWSTVFQQGEDFATLSQAFLYAGARNVVSTLWRIHDRGAAVFAERFYAHLEEMGPSEALGAAQRDLMRDPRWSHPHYWGPYVLSGG